MGVGEARDFHVHQAGRSAGGEDVCLTDVLLALGRHDPHATSWRQIAAQGGELIQV
jgi:hypothetical protein